MRDDLDNLLEKAKDSPLSEISDPDKEAAALTAEEAGPVPEKTEGHASANLTEYLQAARERALESEREFKKSLQAIQAHDPALAKKTRQMAVGILIIVLIFVVVLMKSIIDMRDNASPSDSESGKSPVISLSEADKLRMAQDVNDNLRVANLTRIAELAVVYHLEQKADLPISSSLVRLRESNPVSEYLNQALSRYGESAGILLDPKDPDYYYAYKSTDGRTIEFSARIENEDGRYCEYGQNPCIYQKVITPEEMGQMNLDLERYK